MLIRWMLHRPPRDPDLLGAVGGRATREIAVLGLHLVTAQLEEMPHLPAVGPAHRQSFLLGTQGPAAVVELLEAPMLLEALEHRVVAARDDRDPHRPAGLRMVDRGPRAGEPVLCAGCAQ